MEVIPNNKVVRLKLKKFGGSYSKDSKVANIMVIV
jgi:hypothetical protein